ncbi:hypothetical protein [Caenimonas koreensis]|uniref:hypothetical protein n=1 Tax=Caenimonas koreensis TaxID=367474 RepID=UPI003784EDA7
MKSLKLSLFLLAACAPAYAMTIDLNALWDFRNPDVSEQRFRAAMSTATGDDALILQTQIARTYGLRKDFDRARQLLDSIAAQMAMAGPEARARYQLELGRAWISAAHPPQLQTTEARDKARTAYERVVEIAMPAGLEQLAIDAYHMLAFVDTEPLQQIAWNNKGLAIALASKQPNARAWEASLRNNTGNELHRLGRDEEALVEFRKALALRQQGNNAYMTHVAHWMVAMTLRSLGRLDEALAIQLRLEQERQAANEPDEYVFEELEAIYRAKGDEARAKHYAQLNAQLKQPASK